MSMQPTLVGCKAILIVQIGVPNGNAYYDVRIGTPAQTPCTDYEIEITRSIGGQTSIYTGNMLRISGRSIADKF